MPENPPNPAWKNQGAGPVKKETPGTPGWKKDGGAVNGPAAATPASSGPRAWQGQQAAPAAERPRSKGGKIALALALMGLIIGGAVYVAMLLWPHKPVALVLLGSSYDVNLAVPHNVYGWNGLKDLAGESHLHLAYPAGEPVEAPGNKSWDKLRDELPKSLAEKAAIVFLSFHGGADGSGAFLFLDDPRGREKIPIEKILDELLAKWPGKDILLVLEPAQVPFHWPSGMLQNQFVRELKKLEESKIKKHPNLVVLCASDEDQVSWPSEEWRRTIFTHYLLEGLRGAANQSGYGRVNASDLFHYVKDRVAAWAQTNRGAAQTPILLGGEDRARRIELAQIKDQYTERRPDDAPGLKFSASKDLEAAWIACDEVREQAPGPWAYTPQLWREYRDTLVRWEHLERAGASPSSIAILKSRASGLELDIRRKARVDIASAQPSLALPLAAVLGATGKATSTELDLTRLRQAKDKDQRTKILEEALKRANVGEDPRAEQAKPLYGQFSRQLLSFLRSSQTIGAEDAAPPTPAGEESKARIMARVLDDAFRLPRPAELHYLVMLLEDLDVASAPSLDLVRKALEVRMLAEDAALSAPASGNGNPYAEVVYAWVKPSVEDGDKDRRLGEDWLFGAGAKEWQTASQLFDGAKSKYRKAQDDGAVVRKALDMRDRVLADLPYYARWLALRKAPRDAEQAGEFQELMRQVERLAKAAGEVSWCLEQAEFQGKAFDTPQPRSDRNTEGLSPRKFLTDATARMTRDFQAPTTGLRDKYTKACDTLNKEIHQPALWHDMEAALAVPLLEEPGKRLSLLENTRGTSRKLHEDKLKFTKEEKEARDEPAVERLRRQLPLAGLVYPWQDNQVLVAVKDGPLDALAEKVSSYWKELPQKIAKSTSDVTASAQESDLAKAAESLREPDFLSRLVGGGLFSGWKDLPFGAAEGLRRLRLHDLLLWQAKRVKDDFWFDENRTPYYEPTAKAYARMARDLAESGTNELINASRRKVAEAFSDAVKRIDVTVKEPANVKWTSEPRFPLTWTIEADGAPTGVPMYWLRLGDPLRAVQKPQTFQRKAAAQWPPQVERYALEKPAQDDGAESASLLSCLYRGRLDTKDPKLKLWKPETIANHVPPEKSGLAFRLDQNFHYGAISIVLDCSGSMISNRIKEVTRFEHAIRALDAALKVIPDDTFVSLIAFVTEPGGGAPKYRRLQDPERWKESDREDLIRKVRKLDFKDGASPIAKALVIARDMGFPPEHSYDGQKLIVALTDGDDTYSFPPTYAEDLPAAQRPAYNARVSEYMKEQFQKKGIEIHMICFNKEDDPESGRAKEQFKSAIEDFIEPRGSFKVQPNPNQLALDLELAIRPKLYLYKGSQPIRSLNGEPISPFGREFRFAELPKGEYTAWAQKGKGDNIGRTHIGLDPGDFMVLTLKREGRALFFERGMFAPGEPDKIVGTKSLKIDNSRYLVSVLQNEIVQKKNTVNQLITVEQEQEASGRGAEERLVQQRPPGFAWLEVKPVGAPAPKLVTWRRDYNYPAPALSVEIQDWPVKKVPVDVKLWLDAPEYPYSPDFARVLTSADVKRIKKDNVAGPSPLRVSNAQIAVEDIVVEKHSVPSGGAKIFDKSCLVVRVRLENKKPVKVLLQPSGKNVRFGEEHRYYSEADKYTALFWDVPNPEQMDFSLHVISLDDFKSRTDPVVFELSPPTIKRGPNPVRLASAP